MQNYRRPVNRPKVALGKWLLELFRQLFTDWPSCDSIVFPRTLVAPESAIPNRDSGDSESCDSNRAIPRSLEALIGCDSDGDSESTFRDSTFAALGLIFCFSLRIFWRFQARDSGNRVIRDSPCPLIQKNLTKHLFNSVLIGPFHENPNWVGTNGVTKISKIFVFSVMQARTKRCRHRHRALQVAH